MTVLISFSEEILKNSREIALSFIFQQGAYFYEEPPKLKSTLQLQRGENIAAITELKRGEHGSQCRHLSQVSVK